MLVCGWSQWISDPCYVDAVALAMICTGMYSQPGNQANIQ
ncbi:MAG: hypothetical protein RHS_1186 [Robinsoniella sp. RHS]|nr:MAG: hypothetical protein RHS_1186 [Robinsoniella sp. RHS]